MGTVTSLASYQRSLPEERASGGRAEPRAAWRVDLLLSMSDMNAPWEPATMGRIVVSITAENHICMEAMRENGTDVLRLCKHMPAGERIVLREILDFLMAE